MLITLIFNIFTFFKGLSYEINRKRKRVNLKPETLSGYFKERLGGQKSQQLDETCLSNTWKECLSSLICSTQSDYVYYI